jgi:hypothetical protein
MAQAIEIADAQDVITVHSQDVPSFRNSDAKITLDNEPTKHWGMMDTNGAVVFNTPNGTNTILVTPRFSDTSHRKRT